MFELLYRMSIAGLCIVPACPTAWRTDTPVYSWDHRLPLGHTTACATCTTFQQTASSGSTTASGAVTSGSAAAGPNVTSGTAISPSDSPGVAYLRIHRHYR